MKSNEWQLWATISELPAYIKSEVYNGYESTTVQILHISSAFTQTKTNHEINSIEDYEKILSDNPKIDRVMFYFGWCPRRAVVLEKAQKWVKKLLKDKARINKEREMEAAA